MTEQLIDHVNQPHADRKRRQIKPGCFLATLGNLLGTKSVMMRGFAAFILVR